MFLRQTLPSLALLSAAILLSGCMNMPTNPSQIAGAYTSELPYRELDCSRLSIELNALARRENQLVIAQEQRIKSSGVQAFWYGVGHGDGIEASELANVRGQAEAVRRAMDFKRCWQDMPIETID